MADLNPSSAKTRTRQRQEAARQRRKKAYLNWLAGYKLREIAEMLHYNSEQAVHEAIKSYRSEADRKTRTEARLYVLETLDALKTRVWPSAAQGDVRAVDSIVKLTRLYAELQDLFAPRRLEHTGADGGPIQFAQLSEKELDDLLAGLFAQVAARAERNGGSGAGGAGAAGGAAA